MINGNVHMPPMLGSSAVHVLLLGLLPHVHVMLLQALACLDSSTLDRSTDGSGLSAAPCHFCCQDTRLLHADVSLPLLWLVK